MAQIDSLLKAGASLTLDTLMPAISNADYGNIRQLLQRLNRPLSSYRNTEGQTLLHVGTYLDKSTIVIHSFID